MKMLAFWTLIQIKALNRIPAFCSTYCRADRLERRTSTGEAWRRDPRPSDGISARRLRRARSAGGVPHSFRAGEADCSQIGTQSLQMSQVPSTRAVGLASSADIKGILGALDESALLEILSLRPTIRDVEEAAMWLFGDRDIFGAGEPLKDVVAEIVAVLAPNTEEEAPRSP